MGSSSFSSSSGSSPGRQPPCRFSTIVSTSSEMLPKMSAKYREFRTKSFSATVMDLPCKQCIC